LLSRFVPHTRERQFPVPGAALPRSSRTFPVRSREGGRGGMGWIRLKGGLGASHKPWQEPIFYRCCMLARTELPIPNPLPSCRPLHRRTIPTHNSLRNPKTQHTHKHTQRTTPNTQHTLSGITEAGRGGEGGRERLIQLRPLHWGRELGGGIVVSPTTGLGIGLWGWGDGRMCCACAGCGGGGRGSSQLASAQCAYGEQQQQQQEGDE
jgi:hypothetical protein